MAVDEIVKCEKKWEFAWLHYWRIMWAFIIVAVIFKLMCPFVKEGYHSEYKNYFKYVAEYTYDLMEVEYSYDISDGCFTGFEVYLSNQWEIYMPYYSHYLNIKEVKSLDEMKDMYYGIINSADDKGIPYAYKYTVHNHALCICKQAMRSNTELQEEGLVWLEKQYPWTGMSARDLFLLEPLGFTFTYLNSDEVSIIYRLTLMVILILALVNGRYNRKKLFAIINKGYYIL